MFKSKLLFILITLLILAVISAIVFLYLSSKKQEENLNQNMATYQPVGNLNTNQNINASVEPLVTPPQISEEEKLKAQLTKMAAAFAERYGSYSNQSDFENLEDLMSFMSQSLKFKTESFIAEKRREGSTSAIYYGITTKSLKTDILDFSPEIDQATFRVSTQRQEIVGSSANVRVYYQDIEIKLIKEGVVWKVDNVVWL